MKPQFNVPKFLKDLLKARSPSGYEREAHEVLEKYLSDQVDLYQKDTMGNRMATVRGQDGPLLLLAGHMDELGLQVKYIDKNGFVYFNTLGGHDLGVISGRRVQILTSTGTVQGVTGKKAVHLMTPEERKKVPQLQDIWIDIGAKTESEARKRISIGDPIVYDHGLEHIFDYVWAARAFDDKTGCYVVCETVRRLVSKKNELLGSVVAVATAQEEVGCRGAMISGVSLNPQIGIAVDVAHATDHPDCDPRKHGKTILGAGPIIYRGPNINPWVFDRLIQCAKEEEIPCQVHAGSHPLGNDSRALQVAGSGIATGCVGIPLRYMHTPSELVDMRDLENAVKLLVAFSLKLKLGDDGVW